MKCQDEIRDKLIEWFITDYEIRKDGSVIINQDVNWRRKGLSSLPFPIYSVDGNFDLTGNHFKNMKNFPKIIYGDLIMTDNDLFTLEGCPEQVKCLYLDYNNLISTEGISKIVHGYTIDIRDNDLLSIDFMPNSFDGVLYVDDNYLSDLTDLVPIQFIKYDNNPIIIENLDRYYRKLFNEDPTKIKKYSDRISDALKEEFEWYDEGVAIGFMNMK